MKKGTRFVAKLQEIIGKRKEKKWSEKNAENKIRMMEEMLEGVKKMIEEKRKKERMLEKYKNEYI